ncbi:Tetratricopeptide repeat protein 28 [Rhynchospora pubera]|uniref:Tetratricopeptide repeat protein 28 n=1 Tax=Rhynchospora pubera TaxID=906938 RepID=A0AAV8BQP3_9POAL|nr:Tetratricopeptide repeat protein 28 [Rhynchospora pubera]
MASSSSFSDEIKAKRLLNAAGSGNLRLFKEIVKDLNEGNGIADKLKGIKDKEGDNAFHFAAARGSTAICQYFLEDLAFPVDFYSDKEWLFFPVVLVRSDGPIFVFISCQAGANVNLKCPLGMAIQQELIEIIECLLEAGADPNVRNEYGWLPVEMAVMVKRKDILEMLFPLTSPVPEVQHWSVQGICQYVNSNAFQKKIVENFRKDLAEVKLKAADFFKKKEYLAANLFYSKAIELDKTIGPGDAVLFSNRSLCCHRMGDGDQALKDALVARRLRPEWPKAFYRMGAALMLLKEYGQASQAFMDGLRLDPTNIEMQKAHREAVDCLRKSDLGEDSE